MLSTVTFFDKTTELEHLTGLSRHELWNAGFNLDDFDFGFVSNEPWSDGWWDSTAPFFQFWLLQHMENHCVGYEHVVYKDRHYYMAHHS